MRNVWLFVHLMAVIVWIGGMFFAHFCMRPVIVARCEPPQRLTLMSGILGRFFNAVLVAVVLIWISGLAMMSAGSGGGMPWYWTAMAAVAALMTVLFVIIKWVRYPRLAAAVTRADWPSAGAALNGIRQLVVTNFWLGVLVVAVAALGPLLRQA